MLPPGFELPEDDRLASLGAVVRESFALSRLSESEICEVRETEGFA